MTPDPASTEVPGQAGAWVAGVCACCGAGQAKVVLEVPHPDAPDGMSAVVSCGGCGLRRLEPRPGPEVLGRYYAGASGYNAYAGRRRGPGFQRLWDFLRDGAARPAGIGMLAWLFSPLTRPLARWLFDIVVPLRGQRGLRVLEVGSGFGDLLIHLQSRGCRVLGTDLGVEAARKASEYGVEVRVGNLVDLALPGESFDVVIFCHSLEHVPDPNVELAEAARLLVPGGRLHLAVPNGASARLALDGRSWAHLSHPLHFWYFDRTTLGRMLSRHGFRLSEPMRTTTRHHALMAWWHEGRSAGWGVATRRFLRFLRRTWGNPDGGDVLRAVAERLGNRGGSDG